jgi:hypothetical protein
MNTSDTQQANKRARWMVVGLALVALSFYLGFIALNALSN